MIRYAPVIVLTSCLCVSTPVTADSSPELIAPGLLSSNQGEYSPTFDSERGELVFMRRTPGRLDYTLYTSRKTADGWSDPEVLPFSGRSRDAGPSFSPSGDALLFDSERRSDKVARGSINLWRVERNGQGWSRPELLEPASVNDADEPYQTRDEYGPVETADGTLHWYAFRTPYRAGAYFRGELQGEFERWSDLPDPSAPTFVAYFTLSADGNTAVMQGRGETARRSDLFYSCRNDSGWTDPEPLTAINSPEADGGPYLTADGQTLFFVSDRPTGSSDATDSNIYSIDTDGLPIACES